MTTAGYDSLSSVISLDALPDDIDARKAALLAERSARLESEARAAGAEAMVAHLKLLIAKMKHDRFGASSERGRKLLDQLEMQLDDLETSTGEAEAAAKQDPANTTPEPAATRGKTARRPLPAHLPRERVVLPSPSACPCCGGRLSKLGESVTETLEIVPRRWKVIQTVREKWSCRSCEAITQPPAPFHPIARGRAGPELLATVLEAKFGQHLPLNRLSETFAREGIDLDVSTLADWVGACSAALAPLIALLRRHVLQAERLHGDDTTVPVLAKERTTTGRLWTYVRDDRPFGGPAPPAALFFYSPDRTAVHPHGHLAGWQGILQADAYAGFGGLYDARRRPGPVIEAGCWAHGRRKFFELAQVGKAPLAVEAVRRIDAIFAEESTINGLPAVRRLAERQTTIAPVVTGLEAWMRAERSKLSRHAEARKAMDYMLKRWDSFTRFLSDGRICLSNNAAERSLRGVATPDSLCTSSSSIWKHWELIVGRDVTRAPFTAERLHHGRRIQLRGEDLERRAGNNLLSVKDAGLDQLAYPVAADAMSLGGLAQSQPGSVFLGGLVGVDIADTADRADPMGSPGLALSGRQTHPIERGRDVLVGPAACHAANDCQGVLGGTASMFTRAWLTQAQFGVLSALPVDNQNDLPCRLVDVDDDLINQRAHQLLAAAHGDPVVLPRCLEVLGEGAQLRRSRRRDAGRRRLKTRLAVADAA